MQSTCYLKWLELTTCNLDYVWALLYPCALTTPVCGSYLEFIHFPAF